MEGLSRLIHWEERAGQLSGVMLASQAPSLTHSIYADDLILFGQGNSHQATKLKQVIEFFGQVSGLHINPQKSKIWFSQGCSEHTRAEIMTLWHAQQGTQEESYLGVALSQPPTYNKYTHKKLTQMFTDKLGGWKRDMLSHAGRLVLIQSTLTSLPVYTFNVSLLTNRTINAMNSMIRRFFWGKTQNRFLAPVKWTHATREKEEGGLGVRDLQKFNQALMMKAVWAVATNKPATWVQLIHAKYCNDKGLWATTHINGTSKLWKDIQRLKNLIKESVFWDIRNGQSVAVKFQPWYPLWDRPNRKKVTHIPKVAECFDETAQAWNQNALKQALSANHCASILQSAKKPNLQSDTHDRLIWTYSSIGSYTTKLGYRYLCQKQAEGHNLSVIQLIQWNKVWQNKQILPKIKVFIWRTIYGGLITNAKLQKIFKSGYSTCQLCGNDIEDDAHILFFCSQARATWFISELAIRTDFLPRHIHQIINILTDQLGPNQLTVMFNIMWVLWKARNDLMFRGKTTNPVEILQHSNQLSFSPLHQAPVTKQLREKKYQIPAESDIIIVDGSWDSSLHSGLAAICYGAGNKLKWALQQYTTSSSAFLTELQAVLMTIKYITQQNQIAINETHIFTNCQVLVQMVRTKNSLTLPDWRAEPDFNELCSLLHLSLGRIQLRYACRESTHDAHQLANWSRRNGVLTSTNPPHPNQAAPSPSQELNHQFFNRSELRPSANHRSDEAH